jgi:prefoldin beta subunit
MDENQQMLQTVAILQQQLQNIMAQKEALGMQVLEMKKAQEELEKSKEKEVYKIAGTILIKSPKAETLKELRERDETFSLRLKSLDKEEKRVKLKIEEFREKLVRGMKEPVGG